MKLGVIEAPTIQEMFVNRMVGLILSGRLELGEKLPTEREMAEETKISKTAVHGALVELERLGFVETVPRKGTYVTNYSEKGTLETLTVIMKYNGGNLTKKQAYSLFETRLAIEGRALEKLCEREDRAFVSKLERMIEDVEALELTEETENISIMVDRLFAFHHEICSLSENLLFPLILNAFKPITIVFWETSVRLKGIEKTIEGMRKYLDAIKGKDSKVALEILKKDLDACLSSY